MADADPLTAFDDPSFRPIDFVNKLFPNGAFGRHCANTSAQCTCAEEMMYYFLRELYVGIYFHK